MELIWNKIALPHDRIAEIKPICDQTITAEQQKYSLGLYEGDTVLVALLAQEIEKQEKQIWMELMLLQEENWNEIMPAFLLAAMMQWEQGGIEKIYVNDTVQKENLFSVGFSRITLKQMDDPIQFTWLQRGLGKAYQPRALCVIDYTNDFVATDGKLTTGETGQAIEEAIVTQIERATALGDEIFIMNDIHDETISAESKLFPEHNRVGTAGREEYGAVADAIEEAIAVNPDHVHQWDKRFYSAFAKTPLNDCLKKDHITTLIVTGVCTDICVFHTAVDAYNNEYNVIIPADAVASFDSQGHDYALHHFEKTMGFDVLRQEE